MRYHGEDSSSRFTVLETPVALPANCAVCGTPRGPFVDFGLQIDMYGAVIICLVCLGAAASRAGLFQEFDQTYQNNRNDLNAFEDLKRRINEVRNDGQDTISSINAFLNLLLDFSGSGVAVLANDEKPEHGTADSSGETTEPNRQDDSPAVDEGPSELPSSTDNGPTFSFNFLAPSSE